MQRKAGAEAEINIEPNLESSTCIDQILEGGRSGYDWKDADWIVDLCSRHRGSVCGAALVRCAARVDGRTSPVCPAKCGSVSCRHAQRQLQRSERQRNESLGPSKERRRSNGIRVAGSEVNSVHFARDSKRVSNVGIGGLHKRRASDGCLPANRRLSSNKDEKTEQKQVLNNDRDKSKQTSQTSEQSEATLLHN